MQNKNTDLSKQIIFIKKFILYFSFLIPILAVIFHNIDITKEFVGELGGKVALYSLLIIIFTSPIHTLLNNSLTRFFLNIRPELGTFMGIVALTHGLFAINGIYDFIGRILPPLLINPSDTIWNIIINNSNTLAVYCGFVAMIITFFLLITSNKWSIDKLGPLWFKLHKLIIFIVVLGLIHGSFIKGGLINQRTGNYNWDSVLEVIAWLIAYFVLKYLADKKKSNQMNTQNKTNENAVK